MIWGQWHIDAANASCWETQWIKCSSPHPLWGHKTASVPPSPTIASACRSQAGTSHNRIPGVEIPAAAAAAQWPGYAAPPGHGETRDTRRQLQPWRMMSRRTTGWELNPSWRWWQILYYYYLDRTVVPIKIMVNDTGSVHTVVHCKIKRTLTERYDYCCPALYLLIANVLPMLWWPCASVLCLHCTVEIAKGIRKSGNNCRLS